MPVVDQDIPLRANAALLPPADRSRPRGQILKWVGNKFRYAEVIARHLPCDLGEYYEPFVGTGAVLATLAPEQAVAGDALPLLIDLLRMVQSDPSPLISHYAARREELMARGREAYDEIKASYNTCPNPEDLLVISRTCYGGVMRFTRDGRISTPMGPHRPMPADKLDGYMIEWQERLRGTEFISQGFERTMALAGRGDTIYCDPPYLHGQSILYGAQDFQLEKLWDSVAAAVERGARVAVSADGYRRSGAKTIDLRLPDGLFARELLIERGGCMLRRFQLTGGLMDFEQVADRLLLTW
ncbi:MAG: Dam family site-specific DNA-(adenine-N6)-methyltransferase [Solirubrobacteraceae bacterium]